MGAAKALTGEPTQVRQTAGSGEHSVISPDDQLIELDDLEVDYRAVIQRLVSIKVAQGEDSVTESEAKVHLSIEANRVVVEDLIREEVCLSLRLDAEKQQELHQNRISGRVRQKEGEVYSRRLASAGEASELYWYGPFCYVVADGVIVSVCALEDFEYEALHAQYPELTNWPTPSKDDLLSSLPEHVSIRPRASLYRPRLPPPIPQLFRRPGSEFVVYVIDDAGQADLDQLANWILANGLTETDCVLVDGLIRWNKPLHEDSPLNSVETEAFPLIPHVPCPDLADPKLEAKTTRQDLAYNWWQRPMWSSQLPSEILGWWSQNFCRFQRISADGRVIALLSSSTLKIFLQIVLGFCHPGEMENPNVRRLENGRVMRFQWSRLDLPLISHG